MRFLEDTTAWCKWANQVAFVDVDGVVANNLHRLHHLVETVDGKQRYRKDADWRSYVKEEPGDTPGLGCNMVYNLSQTYSIVFLTARDDLPNPQRAALLQKLSDWCNLSDSALVMRPRDPVTGKALAASTFKVEVLKHMKRQGVPIGLFIDDSQQNCLAVATLGVPTLRFYNHIDETSLEY